MEIIQDKIPIKRIREMAEGGFGEFVKAVVDIERKIVALDAELHADLEALLLADGSKPPDLWGINLYPEISDLAKRIEFNSMINIRPRAGNRSRGVENPNIRAKIVAVVNGLIDDGLSA